MRHCLVFDRIFTWLAFVTVESNFSMKHGVILTDRVKQDKVAYVNLPVLCKAAVKRRICGSSKTRAVRALPTAGRTGNYMFTCMLVTLILYPTILTTVK